jgi:hypothetical protein
VSEDDPNIVFRGIRGLYRGNKKIIGYFVNGITDIFIDFAKTAVTAIGSGLATAMELGVVLGGLGLFAYNQTLGDKQKTVMSSMVEVGSVMTGQAEKASEGATAATAVVVNSQYRAGKAVVEQVPVVISQIKKENAKRDAEKPKKEMGPTSSVDFERMAFPKNSTFKAPNVRVNTKGMVRPGNYG